MGVLLRKQKGVVGFTGIAKLSFVAIIVSLAAALISTIWAIYLDSFFHSVSIVGYFSALLTFISFLCFFLFIPLIEKSSKSKIYSWSLFLFALTYVLFAINTNFYFFVVLAFVSTIFATLRLTSFGIMVRDKSNKKNVSRNEGLMYTFLNISFAVGPLVAGYIADKYGINKVFLLAAIFMFLAFLFFNMFRIKDVNVKKKADGNVLKNFFAFFKDKERRLAYLLGGGVNLWWSLIYVFMPLYIIRSHLSSLWVGYFLFAVVVPLILGEYYFGKLAGKIGFRKIFAIGFFIPFVFVLACFFVSNIYFILGLLVLASFGLAMTEPTTEAYFFDLIKGKDELRFYGPYNTTIDVNHFIAMIISATFLLFVPFRYVFLLYAGFMFIMFLVSFRVKKIVENKGK